MYRWHDQLSRGDSPRSVTAFDACARTWPADEQMAHFSEEADDARVRALVSETALADREHRSADRHARAMEQHRADLLAEIDRLESSQDDLLDRLAEGR